MKLYLLVPLLALGLFAGWYIHASAELQRQATADATAQQAVQATRLAAERAAQEQALATAKLDQEGRQKARAAQAARDQQAQETRRAALATLAATRQLQADNARQIEQLQQRIAVRGKNVADLEKASQDARDDQAFYTRLTIQDQASQKTLLDAMHRLDSAPATAPARSP